MKTHTKEEKWLLISCLQKSIRKGFEGLALSYAEKLYDFDPQYLLYQISIIALDDIGLANIMLVKKILSLQNNVDILESLGGESFILEIVKELTLSNKDRTIADLTELVKISNSLQISEINILENLFLDESKPLVNRILAGWELFGSHRFKNPLLTNEVQDLENFLDLNEKIIKDKEILEILKNAYLIYREPNYIALGLLSNRFLYEKDKSVGKHKTGSIVETSYRACLVSNKWLADGIDWHTKEGKLAIEQFIGENSLCIQLLKKLGVNALDLSNVIGLFMFRYNGQCVNKRMVYPTAVLVSKITQRKELQRILNTNIIDSSLWSAFKTDYPILLSKIDNSFKVPDPALFPF